MDPIEQDAKEQIMNTMTFGIHPLGLIGGALLLIFLVGIAYIVQSGLLDTIQVKTTQPKRGVMMIAYKTGKGAYKGAGELFTEACCLVLNREHIGIYYDDPEAVPEADLRFAVGVILSTGGDQPDSDEMTTMVENGYKIAIFPKPNFVVMTTFPFRNTLSIYMGIFRVYPLLKEYIATRGLCAYPALEIYSSESIEFIMPLSKQEEFFVPEFCEEQVSIATTEFSTHPDQESNHPDQEPEDDQRSTISTVVDDEIVFVRPIPPPNPQIPANVVQEEPAISENDTDSSAATEEFEKVEEESEPEHELQ